MSGATDKDLLNAASAIGHVLAGNAPNGIGPEACGMYGGQVQAVQDAFRQDGPTAARIAFAALAKDIPELARAIADKVKENPFAEFGVMTAAQLGAMHIKEPSYIVPGIVPEGASILAAAPKIGKTRLAFDIAYGLSVGGYVLGSVKIPTPMEVLFLALEGSTSGRQKYLRQLASDGTDTPKLPSNLHIASKWPTADKKGVELLYRWKDDHPDTGLVVIDTFKRIRGQARNRNSDQYSIDHEAMEPFSNFSQQTGTGLFILHHTRKSESDDPMDMVSGSLGLSAPLDNILVLMRKRGQHDAVLHLMPREVEEEEFALTFKEGRWLFQGDASKYAETSERQKIIDLLESVQRFMTAAEIGDALEKSRENAHKMCRKLMDKEHMLVKRGSKFGLNPMKFPRWEPRDDRERE